MSEIRVEGNIFKEGGIAVKFRRLMSIIIAILKGDSWRLMSIIIAIIKGDSCKFYCKKD